MTETALVLTNGMLETVLAKTTHGMVRGPCRYRILGIIDPDNAGRDAGEFVQGAKPGIAVFASVSAVLEALGEVPDVCVLGVATPGGVLPSQIRESLAEAASAGMCLVNGLHHYLSDEPELVRLTKQSGGRIIDIRKPRPPSELRFWSGEVLTLPTPRVAVLGTDWASGKRTTASLLCRACLEAGFKAEMIYTGQTGWLQGFRYGIILDATLNDFVTGELEGAILECHRRAQPDIILIEGQAALRNPAGPCGGELIISCGAAGVILQHAPGRKYVEGYEELRYEVPKVDEEVELIRLLGSQVWAVTLNDEGLEDDELEPTRARLEEELGLPVVHPLKGGMPRLVEIVRSHLASQGRQTRQQHGDGAPA